MRVLYIMPRYHTNQCSIMKGWKEHGDQIAMFVQFQGRIENYESVTPVVVGYSRMYMAVQNLWTHVIKRKDPYAKDLRLRYGWPPMHRMERLIKEFQPDIVICRERSWYTMASYLICKRLGIRTFLYNQSPIWAEPSFWHDDFLHRLVNKNCPQIRYTPVQKIGIDTVGKVCGDRAYFAPFVVEPICSPEERIYYCNGLIHLFAIGKYQERKNHIMLLRVMERLLDRYPNLHLEIAGECSDHFHEEYYQSLQKYLAEHQLESYVDLHRNLSGDQVKDIYRHTDLFILASTREPAAVSCIEAMAASIAAISGTDNGTADYIIPGVTGEVFKDCDEEDLYVKIDSILTRKENIPAMGREAYNHVCTHFQFRNYYETIMQMVQDQGNENRRD